MRKKKWIPAKTIYCCPFQRIVVILGNLVILEAYGMKVAILSIEEFYINVKAEDVFNPNTVILFEILDFNHQALMYKDTDIYDKDNFYRVAWGTFHT
jgi:hypothetical protein